MHRKFDELSNLVVSEILHSDRETDRETSMLITILRTNSGSKGQSKCGHRVMSVAPKLNFCKV